MGPVLRKIIDKVDLKQMSIKAGPTVKNEVSENLDSSDTITQAWIWPRVGEFLKEDDIVITETGTANFGIWETKFPKGVTAISQVLWGSIGYSVGACQGAALAARDAESDRRTILFVGDGSFQLTVQEISTMIKLGLKPIMFVPFNFPIPLISNSHVSSSFVICNDGYTIERFIHGMDADYNDIQPWAFKDIVNVFGGAAKKSKTYQVKTKDEVNSLFTDKEFIKADCLQFVELYMPREDAPRALVLTAEASARTNSKQ